MKRILLIIAISSLVNYLSAQDDNWEVYLRGQAVISFDFENNDVWAATDSFLVRLNKVDKSTTYCSYPYTDENGSSYILKIDKNGVKWIARSEHIGEGGSPYYNRYSSIYSFYGNQWKKVKSIGYGKITSLAIDKHNNKWITAVGNDGLFVIEQDSCLQYTPENSGLVYNNVSQVISDKEGNIWMVNLEYLPLVHADIALIKSDGDNWISYFSGEGTSIAFMRIDNQGNPWFQSFRAVQKLDTASNSWSEPPLMLDSLPPSQLAPFAMLETFEAEDKLWFIANDNGVAIYKDLEWSFYTSADSELPSDEVYQIVIDSDGTKWIATANGLAAFNENGLTTSSDIYSKKMKKVELFPNPANDFIVLKMPGEIQKSTVDVLNLQGKVIKSFSVSNEQNRLDVSQFPAGIYLVRMQSEENQILKKFVKQ